MDGEREHEILPKKKKRGQELGLCERPRTEREKMDRAWTEEDVTVEFRNQEEKEMEGGGGAREKIDITSKNEDAEEGQGGGPSSYKERDVNNGEKRLNLITDSQPRASLLPRSFTPISPSSSL